MRALRRTRLPGRAQWLAVGASALLATLPGCSVIVGGRIETPQCTDDSQCDVLNQRDHIAADACARWQCVPGRPEGTVCAFRQERDDDDDGDPGCGTGTDCDDHDPTVFAHGVGAAGNADAGAGDASAAMGCGAPSAPGPAPECYDGKDNNCNAVIDEGANSVAPVAPGALSVGSDRNRLNYSAGRAGQVAALYSHGDPGGYSADALGFAGATAVSSSPVAYQSVINGATQSGCYVDMGGGPTLVACDFADVALDEVPGVANAWFAAAVNRKPCTDGQLRAGYLAGGTGGAAFVIRGPDTASDVFLGVDSPSSSAGCSTDGAGAQGATSPAIAALPASAGFDAEALLAWVARGFSTATSCAPAAAPVRVLGLDYVAGGPTVLGTHGGLGQTLGTTTGAGRPAVAAVTETDSYLVGYGAKTGSQPQVELHLLPRVNRADDTTMLDVSAAPLRIAAAGDVDDVALGPGPQVNGPYQVGVAYRVGCGAGSTVWFSIVSVNLRTRTMTAADPQQLSMGGNAGEPTVLYLSGGVLAPGRTFANAVVTSDTAGGWLVAWVRADGSTRHVVARRVALLNGRPADDVEIDLGPPGSADVAAPRLYPAPATAAHLARLVYLDRGANTLAGTEFLLPPGR